MRTLLTSFVLGAFFIVNADKDPTVKGSTATLHTCAAGFEGRMLIREATVGAATTVCICTSDGAATPAFAWCSFKAVKAGAMVSTCVGGSATVCP